jgi:type IV pilus modification protein PilV
VGGLNAARRCSSSHEGFTLIEVMVALVILGAGMLAMLAVQIQAIQGGRSGRHTSDASALARDRMEVLHRVAWSDASLDDTGGWTAAAQIANTVQTETATHTEQLYGVRWRVADLDPNLKSIDVQIVWDEPKRAGRSYTISSVRHNDPEST